MGSLYDNNIKVLKQTWPKIYDALVNYTDNDSVFVGNAIYHGSFLAVEHDNSLIALQSIYDTQHEAERFACQYGKTTRPLSMCLYGFGNGEIISHLLSVHNRIDMCIVYEPSLDIFYKAMETYNLVSILSDQRLQLFIENVNDYEYKQHLYSQVKLFNFRMFQYVCLPKYRELFGVSERKIYDCFDWVITCMQANYNTLVKFSGISQENSIYAIRLMEKSKNAIEIQKYIKKVDIPCIIIGAGPSLRHNINDLKQAKGRSFMICVDTAVKYCVEQNIIPDAICSVDPIKGNFYRFDNSLSGVPILTCTSADHNYLERIDNSELLYYAIDSTVHEHLLQTIGQKMPYNSATGSVSISAFQLAIDLGFRTVIFVGQDLSFSDEQVHVGEDDTRAYSNTMNAWGDQGLFEVEGYDGTPVYTSGDYYAYLEWFNQKIPTLEDHLVINATEGGARIDGTSQMSLADAVENYCIQDFSFSSIYQTIPYMIDTEEKRNIFHKNIEEYHEKLYNLSQMFSNITYAHDQVQEIVDMVQNSPFYDLIRRYMIRQEMEYRENGDLRILLSGFHEAVLFLLRKMEEISGDWI